MEYAVLNVPGFKIVRGTPSEKHWYRVGKHVEGERATTPYQNPHRWWKGIKDLEVAEYIANKAKVAHWKGRKKSRDFDPERFASYEANLEKLKKNEHKIIYKMAANDEVAHLIPKDVRDAFIF